MLITGAARNLPAVIAKEFGCVGATVAINYRTSKALAQNVSEEIKQAGGRAALFRADVTKREQLEIMIKRVQKELGKIDILVNGSGPFTMTPFMHLPENQWNYILDSNLKAIYLLSQLVAPDMIEKGWGRIINISAGSADVRNHSVYSLANSGVRFITECLALELGPEVATNAISPGQIKESAPDISEFDPTFVENTIRHTPMGRLVTRQEIARVAVLLCSQVFNSVTGQTIRMDGGKSIPR